jgi:hypothetical protein
VHVCREETLRAAYAMAKKNSGVPGADGVTFEAIEAQGVEQFLEQIRDDLARRTYRAQRVRRVQIPKAGGIFRQLSIPTVTFISGKYSTALVNAFWPTAMATSEACSTSITRPRPDQGIGPTVWS